MSMTTTSKIATLLLLTLLLAGACESQRSLPVIAEIGDEKVTVEEFYLYLQQINPLLHYPDLVATEQQRLLDEFVAQRVYAGAARKDGLDQRAEVAARLRYFQQRVLAEAYREAFADTIELTDVEALAYYEKNKPLYAVPAQYLIEHLVYREPEKAIYAQAQLREGRPYLELAGHRESDSDLTFVERNRFAADILLPELRGPVEQLKAAEVTELIYTNYGYHVIRLVEKDAANFKPFEAVRSEIVARLQQAAAGQKLKSMIDSELAQGRVKIHLEDLRSADSL